MDATSGPAAEARRAKVSADKDAVTARSTLEPTCDLISERARAADREIDIRADVVDGAFEAVTSGDVARHDEAVGRAIVSMAADRDVIVLAQASMARVLDGLGADSPAVPVLSSPRLAVERLAATLGEVSAA